MARVVAPLQSHSRRFWFRYNAETGLAESAEHHVALIRSILEGDEEGAAAEADRLMILLDMQDIAERRAEGFSHGQRLKVALARALVHQPGHLLLDEPTSGLDVLALRNTRTLLARIRDEGRSVLFSSHVMQEVAALCDDVVVIAGGRVVAQGTPESLRAATGAESLEDAFVAAIGSAEGLVA